MVSMTPKGYLRNGDGSMIHRQVAGAKPGEVVDHKNGNRQDNRPENLRICTTADNNHNRRVIQGEVKYKGVSWHKRNGKYQATIRVSGKKRHLGYFTAPVDAAKAYDTAALSEFGEYAATNASLGLL